MSHTFPTDPPPRRRQVNIGERSPLSRGSRTRPLPGCRSTFERSTSWPSSRSTPSAAVRSPRPRASTRPSSARTSPISGSYGTRGVGYDVEYLRLQIGRVVGSAHDWPVIIVGLGNLGTALANYSGFYSHGFRVVGLIDTSPDLVGKRIHGLAISDLTELEDVVADTGAVIAVIATPAEAAQAVADRLVYLGVTSILNFAPTVLVVPEGVNVRKVDLGQELQILAYHEQRKTDDSSQILAESRGTSS